MTLNRWQPLKTRSLLPLTLVLFPLLSPQSAAQSYPPCPPPAANEYLLLVRGGNETERSRIQSLLPAANPVLVCNYVDDLVVRAGGFNSLESVNSWALYLNDVEGFETFVARPSETATAALDPTPSTIRYQPQALPAGYAVLIDYRSRPEVARAVQQQLNHSVGLAVYRQRPYLLALYSPDATSAAAILQTLTAADFATVLVDSKQVVRLTAAVVPLN